MMKFKSPWHTKDWDIVNMVASFFQVWDEEIKRKPIQHIGFSRCSVFRTPPSTFLTGFFGPKNWGVTFTSRKSTHRVLGALVFAGFGAITVGKRCRIGSSDAWRRYKIPPLDGHQKTPPDDKKGSHTLNRKIFH